jgi:hypothetical protein
MPEQIIVPDIAGALVGWRCWGLAKTSSGVQLVSHGGTIWPSDQPLTAECGAGNTHLPPGVTCSCGIYALSEEDGFPYYAYDGPAYAVFGTVYLWGEVVRGTRGYRAQYAHPKALFLAHRDWRYAQPLRDAYRITVQLQNPYATRMN